jgi:hypothetical protein
MATQTEILHEEEFVTEGKVATPGNVSFPREGSTPGKGNAPKAKAKVGPLPPVTTDPEVRNKDAAKVAHQTKKSAEPQDAKKTGDQTGEKLKEDEEYDGADLVEGENVPLTKAGMAMAIFDALREMDKDDLEASFSNIVNAIYEQPEEQDFDTSEIEEEIAEDRQPRYISAEDIDLSDDLGAMTQDEDLSEEFKGKAKIIFESAVVAKVNEEIDRLEEDYRTELVEAIQVISEELSKKADDYLTYVVKEWMEENELAIERGLKTEVTEDFIQGLKNLFQEHYIDLPEDQVDVAEALAEKVDVLENALNEAIESNIDLNSGLSDYKKFEVLVDLSDGLADTEIEKLRSLSEGVEYEDEDQYKANLTTIRDNYFPKAPRESTEETVEEGGLLNEDISPVMAAYSNALKRTTK